MKLQQIKDLSLKHYSTQINKFCRRSGTIVIVTSYVTIYTHRFKTMPQGTKMTVTVEKNYRPKYQYTVYFDNNGDEITRKEFYTKAN